MPLSRTFLFHLCISLLTLALGRLALLLPAVPLLTDLSGSWLLLAQRGPQFCSGFACPISNLAPAEHHFLPTVGPGCWARHLLIMYSPLLLSQMYLLVGWALTEPSKKKIVSSPHHPLKSVNVPGLVWKSPWRCELQFLPHPSWWQEEKRDAL